MSDHTPACRGGAFLATAVLCWLAAGPIALNAAHQLRPVTGFTAALEGEIWQVGLQPDGRILVCGNLQAGEPPVERHLIRLHPDGAFDETYPEPEGMFPGFNAANDLVPPPVGSIWPTVLVAAQDGVGDIWIGGVTPDEQGIRQTGLLMRLAPDGSEGVPFPVSDPGIYRLAAAPTSGAVAVATVVWPGGQMSQPCVAQAGRNDSARVYAGTVFPGSQGWLLMGESRGLPATWRLSWPNPPFQCGESVQHAFLLNGFVTQTLPVDDTRLLVAGEFDSRAFFRDYSGGNPKGIDRLPNGNLLVCDREGTRGSVVEYDRGGNLIRLWTFPILGDPQGIAYDPRRDRFYILDNDFEALFVFDGEARFVRALDTRSLGIEEPEGIEVHPVTGNLLVVDDRVNRLFELTDEGELLGSVDLGAVAGEQNLSAIGAEGLAFDATNDRLFISFDEGNWVGTFRFTPSASPGGPALSLLGHFFGTGGVLRRGGDGIAYDPDTDRLWMVGSKWKRFTVEAMPVMPFAPDAQKLQTVTGTLAPRTIRIDLDSDEPVQFFRITGQP